MKYIIQIALLVMVVSFTPTTEATGSGSNYCGFWCQAGKIVRKIIAHKKTPPKTSTNSVPEMDVTVAPLAGFLLVGLVAAGYERRRRINIKNVY
ncbi:MAG: hypothetical protein HKP09_09710 [Enterobacterales bacterium]|nr:hypothetical protein [Enterobacterales bacterium]